jgi:Fe-S cluster assembly ATP-binding protein
MLEIHNLHASVDGKPILKGLDLTLRAGELHAIMGPNGSGKSTLAHILAGRDGYTVSEGSVQFEGEDLLSMPVEQRAQNGLFLAMQYPVELPGVNNLTFMRESVNSVRRARGQAPLDAVAFMREVREQAARVELPEMLLKRDVNSGFSGGEKKRNEILQMAMLQPRLAILDETDSGLDIDALRTVAKGINALHNPQRALLVVTHYQRLLDYIEVDRIHVLLDGRIVRSGDASLSQELEQKGYGWLSEEAVA